MGTRRYARELAMQALFSMDMSCAFSSEALADYRRCFPPQKKVMPFFIRLTDGVMQYKADIDDVVERYSSNWKVLASFAIRSSPVSTTMTAMTAQVRTMAFRGVRYLDILDRLCGITRSRLMARR